MTQEQYGRVEAEGAEFFLDAQADRAEAKSFHKASLRTFGWIDVAMKLTLNPHTQKRRIGTRNRLRTYRLCHASWE